MEKYIGIMSGTSLDGVDTALVETDGKTIRLLAHDFFTMPEDLKKDVLDVCIGQDTNLIKIGEIDHRLGHVFADAVNQLLSTSNTPVTDITAVGSHGQTVFHAPDSPYPFTMQLGDANIIAAKTNITTIADFRRKDMALGGQGAPLVPAFHQALFDHLDNNIVILNIGGIANLSIVDGDNTSGYDTGPGNMLMDSWVHKHFQQSYDKDAQLARTGKVDKALLDKMLEEAYFKHPAPKSTGRELFNLPWLEAILKDFTTSIADVQATLAELTALTIATEVRQFSKEGSINELLACGGGAQNPLLMERLAQLLPEWQVADTLKYGVDADYMEAMAFAWLAHQTMHRKPGNLPAATGASRLAVLGAIYLPN
ncbi:anhydro-N-acetylmuramic acid kinase [Vibrio rumoiensis]|uniref:Anhydro-N-acetylmuramic acid kinase n=1 Tax=Vibrio rumoiensis 1S-45 TaxID=1188252 RepID=A0A1E5E0I2_9VIBR|nr:anhydro-N-acetylmuramic acid kinase [Vibrio rumoiensis]OEF23614.1 anhydro-N-acetylmuramic acid kinase [Vibrio rumoiensis 1S-45]